ncbi:MAG: putative RNA methyltransferase [Planctomycetota bacterium]
MFPLRCPVRNCENALTATEKNLSCEDGHQFDRSKYGYWSLVQPQDRKSSQPGDSDAAVLARQRWLSKGHMSGLESKLRECIDGLQLCEPARQSFRPTAVDLGCGEGTFGRGLFANHTAPAANGADANWQFCGIDLSKRALRIASRGWPEAVWLFANADRPLPILDGAIDLVLSLFGRRPILESKRILKPGGYCFVAVPGPEDLVELRQLAQTEGHSRSRAEKIVTEFVSEGFQLITQGQWKTRVELDLETASDAMAMTYRAVRESQQRRLQDSLQSAFATAPNFTVTLSADLMLFQAT